MKPCAMHLPGNTACPYEAIYVVISPLPDELGKPQNLRRFVCSSHLIEAIHADMMQISGVRVLMASFLDEQELHEWKARQLARRR